MPVPQTVVDFIRERTMSYGKVKLVLKHNKYFVESSHPETLQFLLKDSVVQESRLVNRAGGTIQTAAASKATSTEAKRHADGSIILAEKNGKNDLNLLQVAGATTYASTFATY